METQKLINNSDYVKPSCVNSICKMVMWSSFGAQWMIPSVIFYEVIDDPFYAPGIYTFSTCGLVHSIAWGILSNIYTFKNPNKTAHDKYAICINNFITTASIAGNLAMLLLPITNPMISSDD